MRILTVSTSLLLAGGLAVSRVGAASCDEQFERLNAEHAAIDGSGVAFAEQGQTHRDLVTLEQQLFEAIRQCSESVDIFALMGEVQISLGQISLAVLYGRKAVELNAGSWRAQSLLGSTLTMTGRADLGIKHLAKAAEIAPDNDRLKLNYGSALFQANRLDDALAICARLSGSSDRMVAGAAYNLCGQIYTRKGDLRNAGKAFSAATKHGFVPQDRLIDTEKLKLRLHEESDG